MAAEKKVEKKAAAQKFGDDRKKALEVALGKIEKDFGKGSVMKLGSATENMHVDVIPTGSLQIDFALGVGGLPRGRIVEIYGPESSGKTTLALHAVAQAQKQGGTAAFIDAEHALDPVYASKLGVDIDELYVSQPDNGEQALDICEALVRSGAIDIVVVDSVAALVPRAEIEGDMGDSHVGLQARLMSQALRKLTGVISKTNAVVIFINQLREKVGVMYGNPETTTGGKALKFYASVRIDIRKSEAIKEGKEIVGKLRGGHALRRGHQPRGRAAGHGRGAGRGAEVGLLLQLQRRAHRPGPRQRAPLVQGPSRRLRRRGGEDPRVLPERRRRNAPGVPRARGRRGRSGRRGVRAGRVNQTVFPALRGGLWPPRRCLCRMTAPRQGRMRSNIPISRRRFTSAAVTSSWTVQAAMGVW